MSFARLLVLTILGFTALASVPQADAQVVVFGHRHHRHHHHHRYHHNYYRR